MGVPLVCEDIHKGLRLEKNEVGSASSRQKLAHLEKAAL